MAVVPSDGWERGDPEPLAARMRRLHRPAHREFRAHPRKSRPGYAHRTAVPERPAAVTVKGADDA
ncbi:hypothetical protein [Streptomyces sp. NPDC001815]|uniref:hypothetical protein n=1 Tax=Streptomyces sp. NPDC001815 TaxID=3154526 RepID=UPI003324DB31